MASNYSSWPPSLGNCTYYPNPRLIFFIVITSYLLSACHYAGFNLHDTSNLYVTDFFSEEVNACRPSDVDLDHSEAKEYFLRARQVEWKTIHDHYNYAPCYIEGTLVHKKKPCEWKIRAGATGQIKCGEDIKYFVCDHCDDLFQPKLR